MTIAAISSRVTAVATNTSQKIEQIALRVWAAVKEFFQWIATKQAPLAINVNAPLAPHPNQIKLFEMFVKWHSLKASRDHEPFVVHTILKDKINSLVDSAMANAPTPVAPGAASSAAAAAVAGAGVEIEELVKRSVAAICVDVLVQLGYLKDTTDAIDTGIVNQVIQQDSDVYAVLKHPQYNHHWNGWHSNAKMILSQVATGSEPLIRHVVGRVEAVRDGWRNDPVRRCKFLQRLFQQLATPPAMRFIHSVRADTMFQALGIQMSVKIPALLFHIDISSLVQNFSIGKAQKALDLSVQRVQANSPVLKNGIATVLLDAMRGNGFSAAGHLLPQLLQDSNNPGLAALEGDLKQALNTHFKDMGLSAQDRDLVQTLLDTKLSLAILRMLDNALCNDAVWTQGLKAGNKAMADITPRITDAEANQKLHDVGLSGVRVLRSHFSPEVARTVGVAIAKMTNYLHQSDHVSRLYTWLLTKGVDCLTTPANI